MIPASHASRVWARSAAVVLFVLGFLPIANWVSGGRNWPRYADDVQTWLAGSAIAAGIAVLYVIAVRRAPALWRSDAAAGLVRAWVRHPRRGEAALATSALGLYLLTAHLVFDARPLLVDEVVQAFQARLFAQGLLAAPLDAVPELFSALHLVERDGRVFSQFPPGGPAVLALGELVGAAWLMVPLCGALAAWTFAALTRRLEPERPGVSLLASLLFAFSPFMLFMAGSQMNHVPTLLGIIVAMLALERITAPGRRSPGEWHWGLVCGIALGITATIRPVDALAFAVPAGCWLCWRAARDRGALLPLMAAAVGVLVPVACMLWFNQRTTGAPLLFGYEALWGKSHSLGFHSAPWGGAHTPARGLELINIYALRLQSYLFETPVPSLVACIAALWLARRVGTMDRMLLAASALLMALYFAYWHDGFYLGPRFVVALLPVLALWTARLFPEWRARWGRGQSYRVMVAAAVASIVMALTISIPLRAAQYRGMLASMRWDAEAAARRAGVRNALVFVRESWGAQLLVRLWALGISHADAQGFYRHIDACVLERGIDSLERRGVRGPAARAELVPLLADSARLVSNGISADSTERMLPGSPYDARCVRRLQEDRAGFTVYLPFVLARRGDVLYARDLHARDSVLLARYPSRSVYLVRPASDSAGAEPRFWLVSRDSMRAAWAGDGR